MLQRMEEKLEQGFHCVKLKIGALDFDSELSLIRTLRARFSASDVELRLDANGGFSVTEALQRLHQLEPFRIHSIEQPIRQGQWKALAELCQKTPIPIALDEELIGVHLPEEKKALLDNVSLTPVFTQDTKTLADRTEAVTLKWNFRRALFP